MIYRIITRGILVQRGPGRADLVVNRPRKDHADGGYEFLDSELKPTLVEFDELCQVDPVAMMGIGALQPWEGEIAGLTVHRAEDPAAPAARPAPGPGGGG